MGRFTLVTWNLLATPYVRPAYYPRTPAAVLDPAARHPALVRRAAALDADLLCLQEVEPAVFALLRDGLAARGYRGWYAPKPGKPDGCALFARPPAAVRDARVHAFADGDGGPASGHVAQLAAVEVGAVRLALANTHLKWDPPGAAHGTRYGLRQARALVALLGPDAPAIVCGDLNAEPDDAVLALFAAAGLRAAHPERPPTCNSNHRAKAIDHLLVRGLAPIAPLAPPRVEDDTPLPSLDEPSDHVPLTARIG